MSDLTFENVLEFIIIDIFGSIFKFISRVLSLVVIGVKNKGEKSVQEIWLDKEEIGFSSLSFKTQLLIIFIAEILTFVLILVFIVFIVDFTFTLYNALNTEGGKF
jgi:hypothetical protein